MKSIYAIRDRIAQEIVGLSMYMIMCFRTDEQAARYFADAINDDKSILNKHPADYELLRLGTITETGQIAISSDPQIILTGDTVIALQTPHTNA